MRNLDVIIRVRMMLFCCLRVPGGGLEAVQVSFSFLLLSCFFLAFFLGEANRQKVKLA